MIHSVSGQLACTMKAGMVYQPNSELELSSDGKKNCCDDYYSELQ